MKTYKEIIAEIANTNRYFIELNNQDIRTLQSVLLEMYKDIARLCDEEGITLFLGGGSCLGVVRHKGFIPWDDDLDLMLLRADYEKLIQLCEEGRLGNKYEFNYPNKKNGSCLPLMKIYRKNSLLVESFNECEAFPTGIYIDLFIMDFVPRLKICRILKGGIADCIKLISRSVLYVQYPSKSSQNLMAVSPALKILSKLKKLMGHILSVIPQTKWVYWFDRFVASTKGNMITIPAGRKCYIGETHDYSVFFPPQKASFEGIEVNIPSDYDKYLKNLYHDYMSIPPENKREKHFVLKFQLPQD